MTVRRTLPQRDRPLIGAWCFADHYGPDDVADTGRHGRAPAPAHRPADGELAVQRRDRAPRQPRASHAMVRPGELNLMTGGHGIAHSEVSTAAHHRAARRPAVGGAARSSTGTPPGTSSTTSRDRSASTAADGQGVPRLARRRRLAGADLHPAARRGARARAARASSRSPSTRPSSTACWSTAGTSAWPAHRCTGPNSATLPPGPAR